jgi:transposase
MMTVPVSAAFLTHPDLPIDNNPMEQAIRPFTLGRKNWLFAGSPRGADASAFIYSLIETANPMGWNPSAISQSCSSTPFGGE